LDNWTNQLINFIAHHAKHCFFHYEMPECEIKVIWYNGGWGSLVTAAFCYFIIDALCHVPSKLPFCSLEQMGWK